jgi:cytochrome c553
MAASLLGAEERDGPLLAALASVDAAVATKADAARVASACRAARDEAVTRFGLRTMPGQRPSLPRAESLFAQNCTQCHGPRLLGQQQMPRLAGQHYEYLRAQLAAFKAGKRADLDGNMTAAAQALSQKDIEVLADYLAGLGGE